MAARAVSEREVLRDDGATDEPPAGEVWSRVKRRLRAELGEDVFASWFARLELDVVTGGCALCVPTRFLKSWIEAHYADRVLATYRAEAPTVERISVGVRGTPVRDDRKPQVASRPAPVKSAAAMAPFGPRPSAAPPVSLPPSSAARRLTSPARPSMPVSPFKAS